jgi:hypothetical protein
MKVDDLSKAGHAYADPNIQIRRDIVCCRVKLKLEGPAILQKIRNSLKVNCTNNSNK